MQPAKILLRLKGNRGQVKAFANVRGRDLPHPRQLHLGYLHVRQDLETAKVRLFNALVEKWPRVRKPREIDWADAERKFSKLRLVYNERAQAQAQAQEQEQAQAEAEEQEQEQDVPRSAASAPQSAPVPSEESVEAPSQSQRHELVSILPDLLPQLVGYARRRIGANLSDAEDLVQAAIEQALRSHWAGRSSLQTWLFAILHHRCVDYLRSSRRRDAQVDISEFDSLAAEEAEVEEPWKNFTLADLMEARSSVSRDHWLLLELIYLQGLGYREVASILDISVNTVSSRVSRARQQLRLVMRSRLRSGKRPD